MIRQIFQCLVLLSAGCASQPVVSKVLFEDATRLTRLDVVYRTGGQEHSHPVKLRETEVATALRSIVVRPPRGLGSFLVGQNGSQLPPALSEEMIQFLASQGVEALHQATPLEEMVFYFNQLRDDGVIHEMTSGSLYVQDGRLHLVFANYRHGTVGSIEAERVRNNPLTLVGEPLYELRPGPQGHIENPTQAIPLLRDEPQHISITLHADADAIHHLPQKKEGSQAGQVATEKTAVEKLRELGTMRHDGLITEEEFQRKKKQVLDSF